MFAQVSDSLKLNKADKDSVYISEFEHVLGEKPKVLHAEPLFVDLIRDLGARKGEKEWNLGVGLTDMVKYDQYTALVEYEFAPIDRLGIEIELPFSFYFHGKGTSKDSVPGNKLNSIKLATQYTFFVSEKAKTSLALGYINEFELNDFRSFKNGPFIVGNVYNPFFVAAKRWGNNFHTLIYTGPYMMHHFKNNHLSIRTDINTSFHYMITGTRNFIGVEFNKSVMKKDFDMTIRPQMRLGIADNFLVGIVTGIPIKRELERFSAFVRLIYEPGHKKAHKKMGSKV